MSFSHQSVKYCIVWPIFEWQHIVCCINCIPVQLWMFGSILTVTSGSLDSLLSKPPQCLKFNFIDDFSSLSPPHYQQYFVVATEVLYLYDYGPLSCLFWIENTFRSQMVCKIIIILEKCIYFYKASLAVLNNMIKWMDSISNKCCSSSSWDIIIYVVQHKAEAKWQRCALSCHTLIKLEKDLSSLFNLLNVGTFHFGLIIRMEILMAYTFIVGKSRDLFLVSKFNIVQESFIW